MKEIITHFVQTFMLTKINWSAQTVILKKLLTKYTKEEILYAIDYYANKGVSMYSLGYLMNTMDKPCQELKAKQSTTAWGDDSGTRNQRKFTENNQTRSGEKHYFDLFKEPGQSD
jgi:hypothetical protein